MNTADHATTAPWAGILGKPASFPPSAHRHSPSDIERAGAMTGDVLTWDGRKYGPQAPNNRNIVAQTAAALAKFEETLTVVADDQKALVDKTTAIEARFGSSEALFNDQITALATAKEASVKVSREIVARVGEAEARIKRTDEVMASRDSALARTTEEIVAKVANNQASITTIKQSYATKEFAEAKKSEAIVAAASYTDAAALEVTALATALDVVEARVDVTEAGISAHATRLTSLETTVDTPTTGLTARVTTVETTKANSSDLTALASTVSTVSATVNTKARTFRQGTTPTATATGDVWIDTANGNAMKWWSGSAWVDTTVASAAIAASVSSEASARATADGNLSAQYVLRVVAGKVAGMKITSTTTPDAGDTSEIVFNADVFKIYNSSTGVAPFTVSGGVVRMTNVVVACELDAGSGDTRLYKPVSGAMTYGDTTAGHIALENYAVGVAQISAKIGATRLVTIDARSITGSNVGSIYVFSTGASSFLSILGNLSSGSAPTIAWNNDTILYRQSSGNLKTDGNFAAGGTISAGSSISASSVIVSGNQVVGSRKASVATPAGGSYNASATTGDFAGSDTMSLAAFVNDRNIIVAAINDHANRIQDLINRCKVTGGHGLISD